MARARAFVQNGTNDSQALQARQARGGPQPLAMPKDNAIGRERLDGRYSVGAEKPLKTFQRALAFEHQAHDGALCCGLA